MIATTAQKIILLRFMPPGVVALLGQALLSLTGVKNKV